MAKQRTIRQYTVVIDTDLPVREHERRVTWSDKNMQDAVRNIEGAFVSMVIYDQDKKVVGIFGAGDTPTEEIRQIAEEMISGG
jgi:hypothetical protein